MNEEITYRVKAYYGTTHSMAVESVVSSDIPPPENLEITANSATSVTLNWAYNTTGHEGFKIDRKVNDGVWENEYAMVDPGAANFSDENVDLGDNSYTYRIYSFYQSYSISDFNLLNLNYFVLLLNSSCKPH